MPGTCGFPIEDHFCISFISVWRVHTVTWLELLITKLSNFYGHEIKSLRLSIHTGQKQVKGNGNGLVGGHNCCGYFKTWKGEIRPWYFLRTWHSIILFIRTNSLIYSWHITRQVLLKSCLIKVTKKQWFCIVKYYWNAMSTFSRLFSIPP